MSPELMAAIEAAAARHQAGDLDAAITAYRALLDAPEAPRETLLRLLAMASVQAGRTGEAIWAYDALLALAPADLDTRLARAVARAGMGETAGALKDLDVVLQASPDRAQVWSLRSAALRRLSRPQAALESVERALALDPASADAHNDRALALAALDRFDDALDAHDEALRRRPGDLDALNGAGLALGALGRLAEAQARYGEALAIAPDHAAAAYNLALLRLRQGDPAGWRGHEARWRRPGQPGPTYPDETLWLGEEDIAGRTILLHAEQGLGDTIQFCRYAPLVKARGARVVLEVQPPLLALMGSLGGVDEVFAVGEPPPAFDRHIPLMSLPLVFSPFPDDTRAAPPYLFAPPERVEAAEARLAALGGAATDQVGLRRVGLVWAGAPAHENDRHRSIPLAALEPVVRDARGAGLQPVSLQTPLREGDAERLAAWGVADLGAELSDFADTAAFLAGIDLLITVDTSIAHLAGAMCRPAWLLLPAHGDWRWLDTRPDTDWYPTLRLFRQEQVGRWDEVVGEVAGRLGPWGVDV